MESWFLHVGGGAGARNWFIATNLAAIWETPARIMLAEMENTATLLLAHTQRVVGHLETLDDWEELCM